MRTLFFLLLLTSPLFAIVQDPTPNASVYVQTSALFPKVDPVSGEYQEASCDLIVAGCEPLSLRRFYNHMSYPDSLYAQWRINPESLIKANFSYEKLDKNVLVGQRSGGCVLLEDKQEQAFRFAPATQKSYAHTSLSGQLHPKNLLVTYSTVYDQDNERRFRFDGTLTDGTGRHLNFTTTMHKWHKRKDGVPPSRWLPCYCKIKQERLPNGNILEYDYDRWIDDKNYPTHYRLKSITARNKNGEKLGDLTLDYETPQDNITTSITITGSDERKALLEIDYLINDKVEVWIRGRKLTGSYKERLAIKSVSGNHLPETTYHYDSSQRLHSIKENRQECFRTIYDDKGRVAKQLNALGETIARLEYREGMTHIYDGEGGKTTYCYDKNKRLTSIKRELSTERFTWDNEGQLCKKTLEASSGEVIRTLSYHRDGQGNVVEESLEGDLTGRGTGDTYTIKRTFSKDGYNLLLSEDDNSGKITFYSYIPDTNLLARKTVVIAGKTVHETRFTYDESAICIKKVVDKGHLVTITKTTPRKKKICFGLPEIVETTTLDAEGNERLLHKVIYDYHPSGKILSEAHFDSENRLCYTLKNVYNTHEQLIEASDPLGHITTFAYDEHFNCLSKTDPLSETRWTYNALHLPVTETIGELTTRTTYDKCGRIIAVEDPCGHITRTTYDNAGNITQLIHPDGGIVQRTYDSMGNITCEIDPRGYATHTTYTARGTPSHITYPDGTEEHFFYDLLGNCIEHHHRNGTITYTTYDPFGHPIETRIGDKITKRTYSPTHLLSETDPMGITTVYTYDQAGRLIGESTLDRHTTYGYDTLGRCTTTQKGDHIHITQFDNAGLPVKEFDGTISKSYTYDAHGNRTSTTCGPHTTTTTYNTNDLPLTRTSPNAHVTTFSYSYDGNFVRTTRDPLGTLTTETHDAMGRLIDTQIEHLYRCTLTYDLAGNKTAAHYLNGSTTTWSYGPTNRLESTTEENTKHTRTLYDACGRKSQLIKPDHTTLTYTYDTYSRLARLTSSTGDIDTTYTYDLLDRPIEITSREGTTTRAYNPYGHLIQETLASGPTLTNTYTPHGHRTSLTYPNGHTATFTYQFGYLHTATYRSSTFTYKTRNTSGRPTHLETPHGAILTSYNGSNNVTSLTTPSYTATAFIYDPAERLTTYSYTDPLGTESCAYTHDPLGQITSENATTYTYDTHHNRLTKNGHTHTYNTLSQLTHDSINTYTYDANGNCIQAGNTHYTYDALDRLTSITQNGQTTTYTYDPFHRRLTANTTTYLWDGQNEIGTTSNQLRLLGEGLGAEIGATLLIHLGRFTYTAINDHRGHLVSLLGRRGETYRYSAFGEELTGNTKSPWRTSSKRCDPTGLTYFGRRYYQPTLGRWLTPDPLGFADGPNLYAYLKNSPLTAIDLYGLQRFNWRQEFRPFFYRMKGMDQYMRDTALTSLSRMGGMTFTRQRNAFEPKNTMSGEWEQLSYKQFRNYPKLAWRTALPHHYDAHHLPNNISQEQRWIAEGKQSAEILSLAFISSRLTQAARAPSVARLPSLSIDPLSPLSSPQILYSGYSRYSSRISKTRTNILAPHPEASGKHSTFKYDPSTKLISGYETYVYSNRADKYVPIKRFRGIGKPHAGVNPPFILEPKSGKQLGAPPKHPRTPYPWELPYGY